MLKESNKNMDSTKQEDYNATNFDEKLEWNIVIIKWISPSGVAQ